MPNFHFPLKQRTTRLVDLIDLVLGRLHPTCLLRETDSLLVCYPFVLGYTYTRRVESQLETTRTFSLTSELVKESADRSVGGA